MSALAYAVIYILPAAWVVGWVQGGAWPLIVPAVAFGAIPLLDALLGHDTHDPDDAEAEARSRNALYDGLLRLWVPSQLAILGASVWWVATGDPSWGELAALALGTGVLTGGGGINIAHELMHRTSKVDKALAEVLMTSVTYPWFCVEHVLGHHRRVATPDDPATSRLGESVYAFLPRVLWGSLTSAWRLERDRVARRKLQPFGPEDRRARHGVWLVVLYGGLALLGWPVVLFFMAQSLTAVLLLEVINYVEHYGLQRDALGNGRFERVRPHHSWNSSHRLTGWFLFNLPRHADHHAWASREYWRLRHWRDAPQMPLGYATMVLVALVPPVWRALMDPRVDAVRAQRVQQRQAATAK